MSDAAYCNLALAEEQANSLRHALGDALICNTDHGRERCKQRALVSLRVVATCLGYTVTPIPENPDV